VSDRRRLCVNLTECVVGTNPRVRTDHSSDDRFEPVLHEPARFSAHASAFVARCCAVEWGHRAAAGELHT
jgi:hypothetical protein